MHVLVLHFYHWTYTQPYTVKKTMTYLTCYKYFEFFVARTHFENSIRAVFWKFYTGTVERLSRYEAENAHHKWRADLTWEMKFLQYCWILCNSRELWREEEEAVEEDHSHLIPEHLDLEKEKRFLPHYSNPLHYIQYGMMHTVHVILYWKYLRCN